MSRLRTLLFVLTLALALATAAPASAADSRRTVPERAPGSSLIHFVPQWLVSLFEAIGLRVDPAGAGGTVTTNGDGGDIGLHVDPDG